MSTVVTQGRDASNAASSSDITATIPSITAGNTIVCIFGMSENATVSTYTTGWTLVFEDTTAYSTNDCALYVFVKENADSGNNDLNVTTSISVRWSYAYQEFDPDEIGAYEANSYYGNDAATGTGSPVASGGVTPSGSNGTAIAVGGFDRNDYWVQATTQDTNLSIGNSFTGIYTSHTITSTNRPMCALAKKDFTDGASQEASWSTTETGKGLAIAGVLVFVLPSAVTATPGAGSATLTGAAPTISKTDNKTIPVGAGSATLAGYAPTAAVSDNKNIAVDAGSIAISGAAPSIVVAIGNRIIPVDAGSAVLTGAAPSIAVSDFKDIPIDAGAIAITGYAPTVALSDNKAVDPGTDSIVLTGAAPTLVLTNNITISVPAGELAVTGYAPEVLTSITVAPDVVAVEFTGYAPTAQESDNPIRAPPAGSLALTGAAPSVVISSDHVIDVPAGSLAVTGSAPVIDRTLTARLGSTFWGNDNSNVDAASLTITVSGATPGSLLVAVVFPRYGQADYPITETTGGWSEYAEYADSNTSNVVFLYTRTADGASDSIVVECTPPGTFWTGIVFEVLDSTGSIDDYSILPPDSWLNSAGTSVSIGSVAPSRAPALSVSWLAIRDQQDWITTQPFGGVTQPSGFAIDKYQYTNSANAPAVAIASKALSDTSSVTGTWSTVDVGEYAAAGQLIFVPLASNQTVAPDAGSLGFTGHSPTIVVPADSEIEVPTGALSLTGYIPNLSKAQPDAGSLTITGYAPNAIAGDDIVIQPDAGSLTITGYAPASSPDSDTVYGVTGSATLTGYAPTVGIYTLISIDVVLGPTLSIVGYAPEAVLSANWITQPNRGSITLTGTRPTIWTGKNNVVSPGAGALTAVGLKPLSLKSGDKGIPVGTKALSLTGRVPTIQRTYNVDLPAGAPDALVLTGYAPTIITVIRKVIKVNGIEIL